MAIYEFECDEHGRFGVQRSMKEGPPRVQKCPVCKTVSTRVFAAPPIHYHSQGFHNTDYDKNGDILEQANKKYKQEYGEDPPPPAKDVPRNLSKPY